MSGFIAIIGDILCPFLSENEGCFVIQDNSGVSKAALARNSVQLVPLPPYSPDINIIELVWHDLKQYIRAKPCSTYQEVRHRVGKFFFIS